MNCEGKFLYRVYNDQSLPDAFNLGFRIDLFHTPEGMKAAEWTIKHYKKFGKCPSSDRFKQHFPAYKLQKTNDTIEEILNDLRVRYKYNTSTKIIKKIGLLLKSSKDQDLSKLNEVSERAYSILRSHIFDSETILAPSIDVFINTIEFEESYLERYKRKSELDGVFGIEAPWPTINKYTQGAQPSDLFTIVARTKKGKTHILGKWCSHTWYHEKKSTLVISNELTTQDFSDRLVSYLSCLPYGSLRSAQLSYAQYNTLRSTLANMAKIDVPFIISGNDDDMGGCGIAAIESKIVKYRPEIVFIDGAYLLDDDFNSRDKYIRAGNIARGIKKLAKRRGIPIIITWQLNRRGNREDADTDSIGLTDDLGQDSSLVLTLYQTEDMKLAKRMLIRSMAGRECPPFEVEISWDFDTMNFNEFDQYDDDNQAELVSEKQSEDDDLPF